MPTYEYLCEHCGYRGERFQNMSDVPLEKCPECGRKIRRLISGGTGIISKGKESYQTDIKNHDAGCETCCGREERCDDPPCCSESGVCKR